MKSFRLYFTSLVVFVFCNSLKAQDPAIIVNLLPVNGCDKTNNELVRITIMNQASSPATFVPIGPSVITAHYSVDGGTPVSQLITVGLSTYGGTYVFTFTTPADLSACGSHLIEAWLTTTGGNTNTANDLKNWTIQNDCTIIPGTVTSNTTVCQGANSGTLNLAGWSNGTISSWEYSTNSGASWSPIGNVTTSESYVNLNTTTDYRVRLEGGFCPDAISGLATITVQAQPVAGVVNSSATLCEATATGTLNLVGSVGGVNYWESSTDGVSWTNIPNNTTTQSYTGLIQDTWYRAQIEGGVCPDVVTSEAVLTVNPNTNPGTLSMSQTICEGSSVVLTLAGYTGTINGWEYSLDGLTWTPISNTSNTFNTPGLTTTTRYRVKVQSGICNELTSNVVIITVNPIPISGAIASSSTICEGSSGVLNLIGNTGSINFWEFSTDGLTWTNIPNTTASYNYSGLTANTWYRAQIEGGACSDVYATSAILTVDPITVAGTLSSDQTICEGNFVSLSLASNVGNILGWESSDDGGVTWLPIMNTNNTYNTPNLSQTTRYRVNVKSGVCNTLNSNEVVITVDPLPVAGYVDASTTICASTPNGVLNLVGSVGAVNYWEASNDGVTWTNIANTSSAYAYSGLTIDTWFRAQIEGGACADVLATEAVITIDPATVAGTLNADQTICEGATATMNLVGNSGNVNDWEISSDGLVWTSLGVTTLNYTTTALTATSYYRAVVQNGVCPAINSNSVIITVNPAPVAGSITGSATLCQSSASGALNLVGYVGNIIDWEYSTDNGATWITLANTTTSYNYASLTDTTWYRAVIGSTSCSNVYSTIGEINVLQDSYGGVLTQNATICQKDTVTLTLAGAIGNANVWEESTDNITWSPIATNQTSLDVAPMTTKYYRVTVTNGLCPGSSSNTITVIVNPSPLVSAGADVSIIIGDTTTLSGFGGDIALWSPSIGLSDPNIPNPQANPIVTTAYIYTGISLNGCTSTDTVIVTVNPLLAIDIKNLITANKDGFNDFWILVGVDNFPLTEVHVYDIYGAEVYQNADYKNDWDGSYRGDKLPNGSYYYVVQIQGESEPRKGNLTILGNE